MSSYETFHKVIKIIVEPKEPFRLKTPYGWEPVAYVYDDGVYYLLSNYEGLNGLQPDNIDIEELGYKYGWSLSGEHCFSEIDELALPFQEGDVIYNDKNEKRMVLKKITSYILTMPTDESDEINPKDSSERIMNLEQLLSQKWDTKK